MSASGSRLAARAALAAVANVARAVWAGGLAALGAIVAPVVFRMVPAPTSADAMTVVFRRFDRVALACAALALVSEVGRAVLGVRVRRGDVARTVATMGAAALAAWVAIALAPHIEALHRAGAVRGSGALGRELDTVHALAERAAKLEIVLLLVALALGGVSGNSARTRHDAVDGASPRT